MAFVGIRDCAQFLTVKAMAASGGSENATSWKFESSTLRKPLPTYHCIWCELIDYSYLKQALNDTVFNVVWVLDFLLRLCGLRLFSDSWLTIMFCSIRIVLNKIYGVMAYM